MCEQGWVLSPFQWACHLHTGLLERGRPHFLCHLPPACKYTPEGAEPRPLENVDQWSSPAAQEGLCSHLCQSSTHSLNEGLTFTPSSKGRPILRPEFYLQGGPLSNSPGRSLLQPWMSLHPQLEQGTHFLSQDPSPEV